ncbi:isocitrate dehydrogenase, specific for NADP+; e14 prophage [uncultured Desulfobacterium sp.]|uniref:Isocitrate dehydrogenase [NADP] n=1 Tax=uncultured Desulfobacterium sp. TaxID=201089 RepID=A0A445MZ65_9BACT|nr:isocitrate dehydrogenase, specific for NADP+; e14 prophage [uncultured Desulfobacterium sp.]
MDNRGQRIEWDERGRPIFPDNPVIPYILGDGVGPDIWAAARPIFDKAIGTAYQGKRSVSWREVLAGEKAQNALGVNDPLPENTIDEISFFGVAIKGPLSTAVGTGFRSINVAIRQRLDLYACVRPVRHIPGCPSPVRYPERLDVVIFRENTEDVYAGIEWPAGSSAAREILADINRRIEKSGIKPVLLESAVGIKPMSEFNTSRLVSKAIRYAIENERKSITLVHKGNIMKFTEGAFCDWGYKTAREHFPDETITEIELYEKFGGKRPDGVVVVKDRIADAMFQQLLLRPEDYDVIVAPNLNGDYLSDAAAAQVGGLGMSPGANIGDRCAVFEATHGSAPKYAGQDKVNPGSLILSGAEMFKFIGWHEAADLIVCALTDTVENKIVTYDLARQMEGAIEVKCSEFGAEILKRISQGNKNK